MILKNKYLSLLIVLIFFLYLIWIVYTNKNELATLEFHINFVNLFSAVLFISLLPIINVLSWHIITKSLGAKVKFWDNLRVWIFSNAARLIPGGFWQYPSRVMMLDKKNISLAQSSTALIFEAIMNLSIGALVVFIGMFLNLIPTVFEKYKLVLLLISIIPLFMIIFINSFYLKITIFLSRRMKFKRFEKISNLKFSNKLQFHIILLFFLQYICAGSALFFVSNFITYLPINLLPFFIVTYTFSWLIGYLTIISPGGLGVMELSLVGLLSLYMPMTFAVVTAIIFRIMCFINEAFFVIFASLVVKKNNY